MDNEHQDYTSLPKVPLFDNFLGESRRRMAEHPEFDLDIDLFENLIADFNPEDDVILCVGKDRKYLDNFCKTIYGMDFHQTFFKLSGISKALTRRVYNKLAKAGNPTAMNIQQSYLKLAQEADAAKPINIVVDISDTSHHLQKGSKE